MNFGFSELSFVGLDTVRQDRVTEEQSANIVQSMGDWFRAAMEDDKSHVAKKPRKDAKQAMSARTTKSVTPKEIVNPLLALADRENEDAEVDVAWAKVQKAMELGITKCIGVIGKLEKVKSRLDIRKEDDIAKAIAAQILKLVEKLAISKGNMLLYTLPKSKADQQQCEAELANFNALVKDAQKAQTMARPLC